jgi:hypothetical protein
MRVYSVETCLAMIAHYERAEARAWAKPEPDKWRDLCRISAAGWRLQLEKARAA